MRTLNTTEAIDGAIETAEQLIQRLNWAAYDACRVDGDHDLEARLRDLAEEVWYTMEEILTIRKGG